MEIDSQSRAHLISCDHLHDGSGVRLRVPIPIPQVQGKVGSVWEDVNLAARRFGELDDQLGVAKKLHLDELGQRQRVAEPLMSARRSAETALTNARHQLAVVEDRRAAAFAPPPLDPQDFAGAQRDAEIRQRYRQMSPSERNALNAQMRDGKNDAVLFALQRDPIALGPDAHSVRAAIWEPRIAREKADELQRIADMEEEAVAARGGAAALLHALETFQVGAPRKPRETEDTTYLDAMQK